MHRSEWKWPALLIVCMSLTTAHAADTTVKEKARGVLAKHKEAVVTVKLVISTKMNMMGIQSHKSENKSEITGTIIDPSGLTVVSNFSTDPTAIMRSMSFSMGGQNMKMETQTDITDAKIVLADGTELPAKMVLKDKDLDLAFLKPKEKPAEALPHLKLATSPAPGILDDIITLGRLGRIVKRTPTVGISQIRAVIKKPRTYYVTGMLDTASMGCPVFNAQGQPLGLQVVKMKPIKSQGMGMLAGMGSGMQSFLQPVILPCEDVTEVAKQALAAKDDKTAEAPTAK